MVDKRTPLNAPPEALYPAKETKMNALPDDVRDALEKAHQYFQPHSCENSQPYRDAAKEAVESVLKAYTQDFDRWEDKRITLSIIEGLEKVYQSRDSLTGIQAED